MRNSHRSLATRRKRSDLYLESRSGSHSLCIYIRLMSGMVLAHFAVSTSSFPVVDR